MSSVFVRLAQDLRIFLQISRRSRRKDAAGLTAAALQSPFLNAGWRCYERARGDTARHKKQ
jgi:hypothetical protein